MPKKRGFEGDSSATEDLIRLAMKHESLRQDFNELCEETDAVRKQLHKAKAMKERLSAEVRFLRRRYKFLKGGSPGKQQSEGTSEKPVPRSIRQDNGTDYASLSTALPPSIPCRVLQPNLQNKVDVNASVRPPAIPVEEKALYKSTRREAMPFTGIAAGFPHSLPETVMLEPHLPPQVSFFIQLRCNLRAFLNPLFLSSRNLFNDFSRETS
eukprot:TRINITY_DN927_c0_g1_i3.p1 TRINITY_DN927_c0_g1~~TRINITY_DN927_c0_g1_i3.p1  ORF type:complete len:211 (-),score=17.98 TRINITY_DN927_c0_g1_i3:1135-1767(-)